MNTLHYVRAIVLQNWMQKAITKISSLKLWENTHTLNDRENQITINFGSGTVADGFPSVTLQLFNSDCSLPEQKIANLSEAPDIDLLMQKWRTLYLSINGVYDLRSDIELDSTPTNVSVVDLDELGTQLKASLDSWLFPIERELLYWFQKIGKSKIILITDDKKLQKIPWHLWRLFESQNFTEYALSASNYEQQHKSFTPKNKVRILAVFGNSHNCSLD